MAETEAEVDIDTGCVGGTCRGSWVEWRVGKGKFWEGIGSVLFWDRGIAPEWWEARSREMGKVVEKVWESWEKDALSKEKSGISSNKSRHSGSPVSVLVAGSGEINGLSRLEEIPLSEKSSATWPLRFNVDATNDLWSNPGTSSFTTRPRGAPNVTPTSVDISIGADRGAEDACPTIGKVMERFRESERVMVPGVEGNSNDTGAEGRPPNVGGNGVSATCGVVGVLDLPDVQDVTGVLAWTCSRPGREWVVPDLVRSDVRFDWVKSMR